jgi:hypothetical protein
MPPKIQINLASALAPVKAPDELWARVDAVLPHSRTSSWRGFAMAAALAALMSGGVLYLRAQSYSSSFAATAAGLHQHREGNSVFYAVQRHTVDGQPVTIVSVADDTGSATSKLIRTAEIDGLAISEWTSQGRRWAMVSPRATHKQACSVCHRA